VLLLKAKQANRRDKNIEFGTDSQGRTEHNTRKKKRKKNDVENNSRHTDEANTNGTFSKVTDSYDRNVNRIARREFTLTRKNEKWKTEVRY